MEHLNKAGVSSTKMLGDVLEERIASLQADKDVNNQIRADIESTLKELQEMSLHARHTSFIPITSLVYTEAALCNTEYMLKLADHTVIATQTQANNYIKAMLDDYKTKEDTANVEINQLKERLQVTSEMSAGNIVEVSENAYMINHDDCVEIVEVDHTPYTKGRVPRFKTAAERDEYLKTCKKTKD